MGKPPGWSWRTGAFKTKTPVSSQSESEQVLLDLFDCHRLNVNGRPMTTRGVTTIDRHEQESASTYRDIDRYRAS
jgi:hypothetical protein